MAVFAPLAGRFTYLWPEHLGEPELGIRILAPFGSVKRVGVVVGLGTGADTSDKIELKEVEDRLDIEPLYDQPRRRWLDRVRRYYLACEGEAWSTALAWAAHDAKRRVSCSDIPALEAAFPALAGVFKHSRCLSLQTIANRARYPGAYHAALRALEAGLLQEQTGPQEPVRALTQGPALNEDQRTALAAIADAGRHFSPFLLFGRTGSGKTEVYLHAARRAVDAGGQVLVLVPEIGLTPMWLERLRRRFQRIGLWHSAMTTAQRLATRRALADIEVLIGTRSALFLPLPRLAMIIVDEEHDSSFKQQEGMLYSARDMAVLLAQELDIPIILGSATPSLESWRQARAGRYKRLDLPHPVIGGERAIVPEIIDMRGVDAPVSEELRAALAQVLARGEQAMLYLNRRGYAPALQCAACGDVPQCSACSLRLALHRRAGQLRCHRCGYLRRVPPHCEVCGESAFMPLGEGTEKLEDWLREHFPSLRFARFDRDTMTSQKHLISTLHAFQRGELDCLIGTQMLVKGHDFHRVTLVGVINADLGVNLPDFRAGERWWQQMIQVLGRAGRGDKAGRALIQTRMPDAPWLHRLSETSVEQVLNEEAELRQALGFPPFARWVRVIFSASHAARAGDAAAGFAERCRGSRLEGVEISGPMPCPVERLAGRFRFEVLLRDAGRRILPWRLAPIIAAQRLPSGVRCKVDVDPLDMM